MILGYALGLLTLPALGALWFLAIAASVVLERTGWVFRLNLPDDEDERVRRLGMTYRRHNVGPFWIGDRHWERNDGTHVSAWMAVGRMGGRGLYVAHGKQL